MQLVMDIGWFMVGGNWWYKIYEIDQAYMQESINNNWIC